MSETPDAVSNFKTSVKDNLLYISFLFFLLAYFLIHLYLTENLRSEVSKVFPRVVIVASIIVTLLALITAVVPESTSSRLLFFTNRLADKAAEDERDDIMEAYEEDFPPFKNIGTQTIWVIAYLVGINVIGFFTFTAIWTFVYTLANYEASFPKRVFSAMLSVMVVHSITWVLFVELLRVSSVFRLGVFI